MLRNTPRPAEVVHQVTGRNPHTAAVDQILDIAVIGVDPANRQALGVARLDALALGFGDDVFAASFVAASAVWYANSGMTAQTGDKDGSYTAPVTAVRLNVTAWTSGTATMTVIQAGNGL